MSKVQLKRDWDSRSENILPIRGGGDPLRAHIFFQDDENNTRVNPNIQFKLKSSAYTYINENDFSKIRSYNPEFTHKNDKAIYSKINGQIKSILESFIKNEKVFDPKNPRYRVDQVGDDVELCLQGQKGLFIDPNKIKPGDIICPFSGTYGSENALQPNEEFYTFATSDRDRPSVNIISPSAGQQAALFANTAFLQLSEKESNELKLNEHGEPIYDEEMFNAFFYQVRVTYLKQTKSGKKQKTFDMVFLVYTGAKKEFRIKEGYKEVRIDYGQSYPSLMKTTPNQQANSNPDVPGASGTAPVSRESKIKLEPDPEEIVTKKLSGSKRPPSQKLSPENIYKKNKRASDNNIATAIKAMRDDTDPNVRISAAKVLLDRQLNLTDADREILREVIRQDHDLTVRKYAIEALGRNSNLTNDDITVLREAMCNSTFAYVNVRLSAIRVLSRQPNLTDADRETLRNVIRHNYNPTVRKNTIEALGRNPNLTNDDIAAVIDAMRNDSTLNVREYAVETLRKVIRQNHKPTVLVDAIKALGRQPNLTDTDREILREVIRQNQHGMVRTRAVEALGSKPNLTNDDIAAVIKAVRDDTDYCVRMFAFGVLVRQPNLTDTNQAVLREVIRSDRVSIVRENAVLGLGRKPNLTNEDRAVLREVMCDKNNSDIRRFAVEVLGRQTNLTDADRAILRELVRSDFNPTVRKNAVEVLGRQPNLKDADRAILREVIRFDNGNKYRNIQFNAIRVLGRQPNLTDADREVLRGLVCHVS